MRTSWSFRCFVADNGTDEVNAWYEQQSKRVKAKFMARLVMLSRLPWEEWREPLFKPLHGECAGLGEIRFFADRVQHRPLGFRSGTAEFTILFCAIERGGKFEPISACAQALTKKSKVQVDRSRTNEIWFALE
jgi:hypothetical protein